MPVLPVRIMAEHLSVSRLRIEPRRDDKEHIHGGVQDLS